MRARMGRPKERREAGAQKPVVERREHGGIGHAAGQRAGGLAVAARKCNDTFRLGRGIDPSPRGMEQ